MSLIESLLKASISKHNNQDRVSNPLMSLCIKLLHKFWETNHNQDIVKDKKKKRDKKERRGAGKKERDAKEFYTDKPRMVDSRHHVRCLNLPYLYFPEHGKSIVSEIISFKAM